MTTTFAFIFLFFIALSKAETGHTDSLNNFCDSFQANFSFKDVIGQWYVVAIIPEISYPDKEINCFAVDFSETDQAGLRWLVNHNNTAHLEGTTKINGAIVRQHYQSEHPLDVWSQAVEGTNGCFKQVFSKGLNKSELNEAIAQNAFMQLHILNTTDGSGPYLVQILWGKMISAVIYRKTQGVTQDQLKPAFGLMTELRGPRRTPKICNNLIKDLNILKVKKNS